MRYHFDRVDAIIYLTSALEDEYSGLSESITEFHKILPMIDPTVLLSISISDSSE